MTLQVCLIGKDGFVLASDTRGAWVAPHEDTELYTTDKIFLNERECAVWCSSGHHASRWVCEALEIMLEQRGPDGDQRTCKVLGDCVRDAAIKVRSRLSIEEQQCAPGSILLAFSRGGLPEGLRFDLAWIRTPGEWGIGNSVRFKDKMSIGARGCSAPFIFKRYYSPDSSQEEMLRIAAHTVLMGHKIDPATIDGLETVVCSRGRLRILSENELAELRKFSEQIDEQIRYKFIEPSASP